MTKFQDNGFETGDYWTGWNGNVGWDAGTLNIVTAPVHAGTFALQCGPALYSAFVVKDLTATPLNDAYFRCFVNVVTLPPLNGSIQILRMFDVNSIGEVDAVIGVDGTGAYWGLDRPNGSQLPNITIREKYHAPITAGTWHCVEIRRSVGTGSAVTTLWIDGVQVLTNSAETIVAPAIYFDAGIVWDSSGATATTIIIDDVVIADAYIGPTGGASTGTLSVTAEALGVSVAASVSVGGFSGTTPTSFELAPNTYTVTATYGGQTLTQSVTIVAGQVYPINFNFATSNPAYIVVYAYAGGVAVSANVVLDSQSGTTPVTFTVEAGTYSVTATYQGVTLPSQNVTVAAGQTQTVNLQFIASRTLTVNTSTGGSTTPSAGSYTYDDGAIATITATASSGYVFSYWLIDGSNAGTTNPISVTMNANHIVTPVFAVRTWALTIVSGMGGSTSPPAGTYAYNDGTIVTVTVSVTVGYAFSYWLIDGAQAGSSTSINVNMTSNHTVEPVFETLTRTLTVTAGSGGTTSPIAGAYTYNYNSVVQVAATPDTSYRFSYWLVDGANAGTANPISITMNANKVVQPVFVQDTVTLTSIAGANGTVSPSGTFTYVVGSAYQFVALPTSGYVLDHWDLSGSNIGTSNPLSLTATSSMNGKTLTAIFAVIPPVTITMTVAVSPANAGATTPTAGQVTLTVGSITQFTATPLAGWDFVQWQLNGTVYLNNPLSLPIIQAMNGQTLTADFTAGKVSITVVATEGGTVNPTGSQVLTIGQTYSYTATPSTGYVFDHWELGGVSAGTNNPLSLTATLEMNGKTLLAVFAAAKISLNVSAGANGSVNPFGPQTLTVGAKYYFGAFPNNGYKVDHWDLNGANLGSTNPLQLTATSLMDGQVLTCFFLAEETPPAQITMNVAISPPDGGTTNPPTGSNIFNVGDLVQFTATPTGDYAFVRWTLDGMTFNENPLDLTIAQNLSGKTLTAFLAIPQVAVTVQADANGTVSPSGAQTLIVGHQYTFAAIGASGYVLDHWELGGQDLGSANPITLTPTTANEGQSLIAYFKSGVIEAGFPFWMLAIVVPVAAGFYYLGKPSKRRR